MSLDFSTLDALRTHHPAWRLRLDHAPLVASFLYRVFVLPNVRVIAARYGFREKTLRLRCRVLITENEVNFLALPQLSATLAVFGSGYGWDALRQARWLEHCVIHYWGDIDTHGFAILDQLRGCFGHVSSLLMDRATLHAHEPFWGFESKQTQADLHRLGPEEQALYDDLRFNRIREGLRLEQEHVGFGFLQEKLARLPG